MKKRSAEKPSEGWPSENLKKINESEENGEISQ
jgi:hypothetical protein